MRESHSWMSPSGEFHPVSGSHSDWAARRGESVGSLFRSGWMRVTFVGGDLYLNNDIRRPTPRQVRSARDHALEAGFSRVLFDDGEGEREVSECLGFRDWLMKENPNGVGLGSGDYDYCDHRDADAVAFIVYRGGYMRAPGHDHALTHVSMYLSALSPDNPLSDRVLAVGDPPRVRGISREHDRRSGWGREMLMPHMVLGRLWTAAYCWSDDDAGGNRGSRRRVVSFWNPPGQVYSLRGEVLSMIRDLDMEDEYTPGEKGGLNDPREYLYEVEGNMMSYDEFVTGHSKETVHGWDPSVLHTMEPGPAKSFIRKGLGIPVSGRFPDLATRMKSYTGD